MPKFRVEVHVTYIYENEIEAEDSSEAREWAADNDTEIIADWDEQREGTEIYVTEIEE